MNPVRFVAPSTVLGNTDQPRYSVGTCRKFTATPNTIPRGNPGASIEDAYQLIVQDLVNSALADE